MKIVVFNTHAYSDIDDLNGSTLNGLVPQELFEQMKTRINLGKNTMIYINLKDVIDYRKLLNTVHTLYYLGFVDYNISLDILSVYATSIGIKKIKVSKNWL
jgi:hypothetical protein